MGAPDSGNPDALAHSDCVAARADVVPAGGIVLDFGANRGQFARKLLSEAPCSILAFEPARAAFGDLQKLALEHPKTRPLPYAISDGKGTAEFNVQESDVGSSLLTPLANQSSKWLTASMTVTVPTRRLDDIFVEKRLQNVDLLTLLAQDFDGRVIEFSWTDVLYLLDRAPFSTQIGQDPSREEFSR